MTNSQDKPDTLADRRSFLKLAAAGTVTGGAAAIAGPAAASAAAPQAEAENGQYRETAHVKRYYDLARF